ncbi:protein phosphatase [Streptomyces viridochromogenes]|uniref:Protein phosphatase n=1 Tax=Streptomyces viridochromogenes TaxID=1938 RepID=A0A0J7YZN4_STRVR|nr:SpoIIE family protein phosphatase [Streptomyces viridochromogenes]KMS68872.1 protein phosphatase [Streptomyces viridochromogenes]KOG11282.1 protein phosphatase [Streptomyces viridochromogenes]KOG11848.1 protein phosphatase [Streptomyces viridochromogenes]
MRNTSPKTLSESPEDPFSVHQSASAVLDEGGRIVAWSDQATALLGHGPDEVLGRPVRETLVEPRDQGLIDEATAACLRDGGWFGLLPVRHRAGHRVYVGFRARRVRRLDSTVEWLLVGSLAEDIIQWDIDRAVLDGFFLRSPVGVTVLGPDLRILRVNRAIARFGGLPTEAYRGLRTADFLLGPDTELIEDRLRGVLETGRPLIFAEQTCRLLRDPAKELIVSVSAFRMQDRSGRVLGVTEIIEDVTDRHRARRRLALLNEAGARIGSTLDVARTARELAEAAVPALADALSVDLLEPVPRGEEPAPGARGPLRRMAVRSIRPEALTVMHPEGHLFFFPDETAPSRCLVERRPILDPFLEDTRGWFSTEPERAEKALAIGVHSLMAVPLAARGVVLGLVCLWRSQRSEPFEEDDLTLAEEFAARAAVCIDNARRYTQQHNAAEALQRSLLPSEVPEHPAVETAYRYLPAHASTGVGGDWFDVIPLSGLRVALVVGDVVGHGMHASATMGRLRAAVRTLAHLDLAPDEVLARLDDLVDELATEQRQASGNTPQIVGATCLYAIYDPVSRHCAMARAGHPPPTVLRPDGRVRPVDVPAGPPLGVGGLPFETAELELDEDSLIALYSDGLLLADHRDIDQGLTLLRSTLTGPSHSLEQTCKAVEDAMLPDRAVDDVTLLLGRTRVLAAENVATWQLSAEPTAAGRARTLVRERLAEWGLDEFAFTTELIVSELVTNAYRYAGGPVLLRLIRDGRLICEVSDTSSTSPHLRQARGTDEGGRGLFLVAQLSERWGTRYGRNRKTIWAEQPLAAQPGEPGA